MSNYFSEKELPVMLTVQDIAAFLRVSKNTAYSFVSSGAIPVVKVDARSVFTVMMSFGM